MHHKNIKLIVRKQLKKQFPNWKRLPKMRKRELAKKVLAEVVAEYDFKQEVGASIEELLAIDTQVSAKGIISLDEMARIVDIANNNITILSEANRTLSAPKNSRPHFVPARDPNNAVSAS